MYIHIYIYTYIHIYIYVRLPPAIPAPFSQALRFTEEGAVSMEGEDTSEFQMILQKKNMSEGSLA